MNLDNIPDSYFADKKFTREDLRAALLQLQEEMEMMEDELMAFARARGEAIRQGNPRDRVITAAIRIADAAPNEKGKYVSSALIYWPLIEELRAALDAAGIKWEGKRYAP